MTIVQGRKEALFGWGGGGGGGAEIEVWRPSRVLHVRDFIGKIF